MIVMMNIADGGDTSKRQSKSDYFVMGRRINVPIQADWS